MSGSHFPLGAPSVPAAAAALGNTQNHGSADAPVPPGRAALPAHTNMLTDTREPAFPPDLGSGEARRNTGVSDHFFTHRQIAQTDEQRAEDATRLVQFQLWRPFPAPERGLAVRPGASAEQWHMAAGDRGCRGGLQVRAPLNGHSDPLRYWCSSGHICLPNRTRRGSTGIPHHQLTFPRCNRSTSVCEAGGCRCDSGREHFCFNCSPVADFSKAPVL